MSQADQPDQWQPIAPRANPVLYGHAQAERALLDAYRSGRVPHAWLIAGSSGIGKATLAYRMARFVLTHPDHNSAPVGAAASLHVDPGEPAARRIAAQAHGSLLVLERTINEKTGKLRQDIQVDDVRRTVSFFGSTAAEQGWRVVVVDCVDELNSQGANALLKILEEPPRQSLLLLVSHSAGRVLPTIRSRCRILMLRPLPPEDVARAAAAAIGSKAADAQVTAAAAAAEGSVRRALTLLDRNTLELRNRVLSLLDGLPAVEPQGMHMIGDRLFGTDAARLEAFVDTVNGWLAARLVRGPQAPANLDRLAHAWEKFNVAAQEVEEFNLERKPLVFNTFAWLAEACRG